MASGALTPDSFDRLGDQLPAIRDALAEHDLDAWVLYDLHARNPITAGLIGVGDLSRRIFVVVPRSGEPLAITHGIEAAPWTNWPWRRETYVGWQRLDEVLGAALGGMKRVALETVERNAVPGADFVPGGVVQLIESAGPEVVSSGDLVSRFYARWSDEQLAGHRRSAETLRAVAREAFEQLAERVGAGKEAREGWLKGWIIEQLTARGVGTAPDCIVATGRNAANPHYNPPLAGGDTFARGDVVLIDLWGKDSEAGVFADQTWMAVLGPRLPDRVQPLWDAIRDGREAGVSFLQEQWQAGRVVQGYEVDDVVRGVVRERGHADAFIHRTGHSIDRDTHGTGPNIDNFETHEVRRLIEGVGFSVEPGVYYEGDVGLRTEINVFMGANGPEVTPSERQAEPFALLDEA